MNMTYNETLKEIRKAAREVGLTLKKQNSRINGAQAWKFIDRETGETVMSNCTLSSAYNNVCSGFIRSYNKDKRAFDGVSHYE